MGVHPHTYVGYGFSLDFYSYSRSAKLEFLEFFAPKIYKRFKNISKDDEVDFLDEVFGGAEPYLSTTSNGFRVQIIELENMLFVTTCISHHSEPTGKLKTDLLDLKKIKRAERNMTELFEEGARNYLQVNMRGKEYPKPGFFIVTFMR